MIRLEENFTMHVFMQVYKGLSLEATVAYING